MSPERDLILFADRLLDPDAELELMERLEADPDLQLQRALIAPTPAPDMTPPRWRIPPPGTGWQLGAARLQAPMVMNHRRDVTVGRRFQLQISAVPRPEARQVVILRRLPGSDWEVISPQRPGQQVPLDRLTQADGGWELNLMATGPAGPQRWAIALPDTDMDVDWDASPEVRWAPLRDALSRGQVPAATAHITVQDR